MGHVEVENVEVTDNETIIIDSTLVDADKDKDFSVDNGDSKVTVKAWGSVDGVKWELKKTMNIPPNSNGQIRVDKNMIIQIKLTGICQKPGDTTTVGATLDW